VDCPRCYLPLYETTVGKDLAARALQCSKCEGHWLSQSVLDEVSRNVDVKWWEKRHLPSEELQRAPMRCPSCGIPTVMRKVKSPRDRKVDMDVCPTCHGVWLDGGELAAIREMGPFHALTDLVQFLFKG
jgi:Zn-finger nucleic acid-binding protein